MSENSKNKTDSNNLLNRLINSGAEITSGSTAGALSFLATGSTEAALFGATGVAVAIALRGLAREFSQRFLGPREEVRIGAVIALSADQICARMKDGESLRNDGFFDKKTTGRADAEEVIESVLLKCQKDPEEKKIKYMANLLSNICFNSEIDVHMSHQIIKAAEGLTYRQLCILKVCAVKESLSLRNKDYRGQESFPKSLYPVLYECYGLYMNGYINLGGTAAIGLTDVIPNKMTVQGLGADIFNLMGLQLIPLEDLTEIVKQLK